MKHSYPIISNCNFESRDDDTGRAIHAAAEAARAGLIDDQDMIEALDALEEMLEEHAESQHVVGMEACNAAEHVAADRWAEIADDVWAAREARYSH